VSQAAAPTMPAAATATVWCRVLIVEQGEGLWGAQRYLLRLAPLLEERGIEQVLAAPADSATAAAWVAQGRPHVELPTPTDRSMRGERGQLHVGRAAREVLRIADSARRIAVLSRSLGVDVLHANSHWSHPEAALASRWARIPAVLHLHEESSRDAIGRLRGYAVIGCDAAVAVSDAVARSLPRRAVARATVIHNGVDPDALRPGPADLAVRGELSDAPDAALLLTLSRLDPLKGVDQVIRAVAALPPELSDTCLAIAGAPSLVPEHGQRLRDLGAELLGERVRFLGARNDVQALLLASDALVLGSSLEGLPLSVLEAQACGVPVVAYPTAGIPEVVTHGETGLLAQPGDHRDLAAQLARLLSDAVLRERLGAAGRARVLAEGTLALQADRQAELLRAVLNRRRQA